MHGMADVDYHEAQDTLLSHVKSPQFWQVFGLMTILLWSAQLRGLAAGAFFGMTLLVLLLNYKSILRNKAGALILVFPVFGILSALWSIYPSITIRYGIQAVLTVLAALAVGSSSRPQSTFFGFTFALIIFAVCSTLFGSYAAWERGEVVFVGLSGSKNGYAAFSTVAFMFSFGLMLLGLDKKKGLIILLGLTGAVLGAFGLLRSHGTGALLSGMTAVTAMSIFFVMSRLPKSIRLQTTLLTLFVAGCVGVMFLFFQDEIFSFILKSANKDPSLTGRTTIWATADEIIRRKFWLGVGHWAFWTQGNPDAERLWFENGIRGRLGFNFHNTYRETMVAVGAVGLAVFGITFFGLFVRQVMRVLKSFDTLMIVWTCAIISPAFTMPFESVTVAPMNMTTMLLGAALSFVGFRHVQATDGRGYRDLSWRARRGRNESYDDE